MKNHRREENATVAVYESPASAEETLTRLQSSGFDMQRLSIIGKDCHAEGQVTGCYSAGDRIRYWGMLGAFWGKLWGTLPGWGFFAIPGIGPVLVAGPLAGWIVAGLENAALFGGLSALGAGLYSMGIPKHSILRYESALKAGKFLVIAHGSTGEVEQARRILETAATSTSAM